MRRQILGQTLCVQVKASDVSSSLRRMDRDDLLAHGHGSFALGEANSRVGEVDWPWIVSTMSHHHKDFD